MSNQVIEMKVPTVGESISEVVLAKWTKKDGDTVRQEEILCEIESDKATFEIAAEKSGILRTIAAEGDTLPIGALLCKIEVGALALNPAPVAEKSVNQPISQTVTANTEQTYAQGHASPAASKILTEKGIAPETVAGSGVGGRITKNDALQAQTVENKTQIPEKQEVAKTSISVSASVNSGGTRQSRSEKMSQLRKTIARRLVSVKNETAMLTTFNEVDMKLVMDIRSKYKDAFKEKHEIGLGFMSFFVKACCMALQDFPLVNAQIDGENIVYNDFCDVSIAVSTPRGLVVPIIRNAEQMSFSDIEKTIVELAKKARENKLSIPEMTGGTFTITNGGIFGSLLSTPIINAPQSAILGMHNIVERPVVIGGQVVIRPMMYLALSYDHRIIDGRESVSFLLRIKQLLEDPARILLGV